MKKLTTINMKTVVGGIELICKCGVKKTSGEITFLSEPRGDESHNNINACAHVCCYKYNSVFYRFYDRENYCPINWKNPFENWLDDHLLNIIINDVP